MAERAQRMGAGDAGIRQLRPWTRQQQAPEARSPRFMDPASYSLKPGVAAETMGTGAGRGGFGLNGPAPVQHFHGGFDEQQVARRAQLEANRSIQRGQARALHDGVMPA